MKGMSRRGKLAWGALGMLLVLGGWVEYRISRPFIEPDGHALPCPYCGKQTPAMVKWNYVKENPVEILSLPHDLMTRGSWPHILRQTGGHPVCRSNLKQLRGAIDQWALEHKQSSNAPVSVRDIAEYLKGSILPVCPRGGVYSITTVGAPPACSLGVSNCSMHRVDRGK
jgi:hypothetical protein